jgi:peptidoglycan/LPS O-acetylase OafA/YrhL
MDNRRRSAVVLAAAGAAMIPAVLLMAAGGNLSDTSAGIIIGFIAGCQIAALVFLRRRAASCARG